MRTLKTTPVLSSDDLNEVIDWRVYIAHSGVNSCGQNVLSVVLTHDNDENGSKIFRDLIIVDSGEVFLSEGY